MGTGSLVATHIVLKTWGGSNTCLDNAPAHFTIQFNLSVLNLYYLNLYLSVLYLCFFLVCEYSLPWSTQNTPCQFEDIKLLKSITPTLLKHRFRIEMRRIIAVLLNVHRNTEASHYYHHHTVNEHFVLNWPDWVPSPQQWSSTSPLQSKQGSCRLIGTVYCQSSYYSQPHNWWWCTFFKLVHFLAYTIQKAKFWHILANFGYFVANLRVFDVLLKGLNNVAMYQNGQIWGMYTLVGLFQYMFCLWNIFVLSTTFLTHTGVKTCLPSHRQIQYNNYSQTWDLSGPPGPAVL